MDAHVTRWHTEANAAAWSAERASWDAGEDMICSTAEMFDDMMFARLESEASKFVHAADPQDVRRWLVPGLTGGPLLEVVIEDGELYDAITGRPVP